MKCLHASAVLLVASCLGRMSAATPSSPVSRTLQQNFNNEEIAAVTELSSTSKSQPVEFTATFTNLWTESRHPVNFPSRSAHWSPMVFASHSEKYTMWCDGCIANSGIEIISETGAPSTLESDIDLEKSKKIVLDQGRAPGMGTPVRLQESTSASSGLCVDAEHPLVSSISMIAPSPDWFSGLYNLRLWTGKSNGDGVWYKRFQAYVFAWDAGTEEGDSYSLSNQATSPKQGMSPFTAENAKDGVFVSENSNGGSRVLPVGIITFELQGTTSSCTSTSNSASMLTPTGEDTADTFYVRAKGQLLSTTCGEWLIKRPHRRCRRMIMQMNGTQTARRVRDLCRMTCASM